MSKFRRWSEWTLIVFSDLQRRRGRFRFVDVTYTIWWPPAGWALAEGALAEPVLAAVAHSWNRMACDVVVQVSLCSPEANNSTSSTFTCHISHATHRTSHVTHHTSHLTRHTSHVTRHTPHVTRHTPHVTCHKPHITRHTSHITHHTPYVTHHRPHITRHI